MIWKISFRYIGRITVCRVVPNEGKILVGCARCAPGDRFVKEVGRKLALKRAIEGLDRSERRMIWLQYFSRKTRSRIAGGAQ